MSSSAEIEQAYQYSAASSGHLVKKCKMIASNEKIGQSFLYKFW